MDRERQITSPAVAKMADRTAYHWKLLTVTFNVIQNRWFSCNLKERMPLYISD